MPQTNEALPREILDSGTKLLLDLCSISSASGDVAGVRAVADRIATELARCGLAAEVASESDDEGNPLPLLVARGPEAGEHPLLLVGHLDTVLDAVPPRIEDGRLWATGALDMKGGLAMLVAALDLLASRGERPPADLMLVGVPDEEVGGTISERAVRRWGQGARVLLVIEPGERRGDAETLVAGRRGLFEWKIEVSGRAAHSGLAYWQGRSALGAAADWTAQAQRMSETGAGVTVNAARLVGGDTDFVDGLATNHALLGTSRRRNVVSDRAIAEGEARFLSAADGLRILGRLQRLTESTAATHDVRMTFSQGMSVPPVDPNGPGAPVVRRVMQLAADRGWRLEVEDDRGGISFPNYVADPAKVAIVDGLGPVGDGMHTREEHLDMRSFERRIVLLADLLASLAHRD
ncbi:MAG: M20/M25/M40 family metallo-hydrolase [Thermoanaerobaculaceae bacterium]|nr:M20/M25/M40 family metallo-hydrolase [Thermoanaerobaculaceae bacterium]